MLLDRHRVARLIELSELARHAAPAVRALREEEVALLVKAAYDDASDAARQAFMHQVRASANWPWSAVTAGTGVPPPLLTLLQGQVIAADDDPGDRLPGRGQLGSRGFEALHQALARWDTAVIRRHIALQGWIAPSDDAPRDLGFDPRAGARLSGGTAFTRGATSGTRPGGGVAPGASAPPGGNGTPPPAGDGGGGSPPSGDITPPAEGAGVPSDGGAPANTHAPWTRGAYVLAAAATLGTVGLVALAISRSRQAEELRMFRERMREYEG